MKSQKGITMISLILYVASFVAVTAVVAGVTTFFYNNMQIINTGIGSNSSYNKLNLYLVNECKKPGVQLYAIRCHDKSNPGRYSVNETQNIGSTDEKNFDFMTFKTDDSTNSFIYDNVNQNLYYNSIKLCEQVEDFQLQLDKSTGKDVVTVFVVIDGTAFQTKYVVGS